MRCQNLFEALERICGFTALESDMAEIIAAYKKDKAEGEKTIKPCKKVGHLTCNHNFVQVEDTYMHKCSICDLSQI